MTPKLNLRATLQEKKCAQEFCLNAFRFVCHNRMQVSKDFGFAMRYRCSEMGRFGRRWQHLVLICRHRSVSLSQYCIHQGLESCVLQISHTTKVQKGVQVYKEVERSDPPSKCHVQFFNEQSSTTKRESSKKAMIFLCTSLLVLCQKAPPSLINFHFLTLWDLFEWGLVSPMLYSIG